ncbi:MAG TPA: hypothetical protein VFD49_02755 [Candidatus Dormibacteraeota bacterium]|nr:hypothetical protein [Candidatus Dormibacteraeota bacterium]
MSLGRPRDGERPTPWAVCLVAGALAALGAQFALEGWAEASEIGHWIQHGVIFWSGVLVGLGILRLYQLGGGRA